MTMQETLLEHDISNLDLSNVAALQQKRTLAFVNHFVITTVQFLNNFTKSCEQKLMHFERKLEKVNATMVLLEAKLSSIPEVNTPQQSGAQDNLSEPNSEKPEQNLEKPEQNALPDSEVPTKLPEPQNDEKASVKPEYERFVKMVQVGVPLDAVKLKISLEGLDPSELDRIMKK